VLRTTIALCALVVFTSCGSDRSSSGKKASAVCNPSVSNCATSKAVGERCTADDECGTEFCAADAKDIQRCCDESCTDGCNANGRCLEAPEGAAVPPSPSEGGSAVTGQSPATNTTSDLAGGTSFSSTTSPSTAPETDSAAQGVEQDGSGIAPSSTAAPSMSVSTMPTVSAADDTAANASSATPPPALPVIEDEEEPCEANPVPGCACEPGDEVPCGPETDDGVCAFGVSICQGGVLAACEGGIFPGKRDCESDQDNDCDGKTDNLKDDVCTCSPGVEQACEQHPGFDDEGVCKAGKQICNANDDGSTTFGECTGAVAPRDGDDCSEPEDSSSEEEDSAEEEPADDESEEDEPADDESEEADDTEASKPEARVLWSFDNDAQGWQLRLTDPEKLKANTQLNFSGDQGDPKRGSLRINVPFDDANQKVEFNIHPNPTLDATDRTFRARVMLVSGLSSDKKNPGGIIMFAKSGPNYDYISGKFTYLTKPGEWADVVLEAGNPAFSAGDDFDLEDVREVGFELRTFEETEDVSAAVVHVDSVSF
jgi:hypothetical protein